MIFHPDLAQKILDGEKTVTRRRVKHGQECRYVAGRTYAIQPGRGKPAVGRLRILDVKRVTLASMTFAEARLEGFRGVTAFYERWRDMYGDHTVNGHVWRIEFEVVE